MKVLLLVVLLLSGALAQAKNVILFVGDGMGISTVTAARIYAGQKQGLAGEEYQLSFDKFGNVALIKTYNTDAQVADSAGTITALMTGEKTKIGVLGVSDQVLQGNCVSALQAERPTLLELAEVMGKQTGIVTTTSITHATPAGAYAHSASRNWESDATLPAEAAAAGCRDIARQLAEFSFGDGPEVVLGGGRAHFLPQSEVDPEYPDVKGVRQDGRNLITDWQAAGKARQYVWNQSQFDALDPQASGQVLGLFEPSHLKFEADRATDAQGEPALVAMTDFAIRKLQRARQGYFLLVEGGRIDHGHHAGNAYRALEDTVALDAAVARAVELVDLADTLIIVTADHSHTLTISGYPTRGNPILGKVVPPDSRLFAGDAPPPYTTLSYANGPGYQSEFPDLTEVDTQARDYRQIAAVPLPSETHAGEDVAAFAEGLNATGVRGVMEQNRLFHVMHEALFGKGR